MEEKIVPNYMTQTFSDWARSSCLYLNEAENITANLYDAGKVHTPDFKELFTYEHKYVIGQLVKEGY